MDLGPTSVRRQGPRHNTAVRKSGQTVSDPIRITAEIKNNAIGSFAQIRFDTVPDLLKSESMRASRCT